MGHYHYDCSEYCEQCLPVDIDDPDVDYDQGEQDSPAHCCVCHCPLDHQLTSDGVAYVIEAIRNHKYSPRDNELIKGILPYYEGSRHIEVLRDWATMIEDYALTWQEKLAVARFLKRTEKKT